MNLFKIVTQIIGIIVALVNIVERPGNGEEKRQQVIDIFLSKAEELLTLPKWAAEVFLRPSFVGWLVDLVVWAANTFGFFEHTPKQEPVSGNSPSGASTTSA